MLLVLVAIGNIVALWVIFKFLAGCILRLLLVLGVAALVAFVVYSLFRH